MGALSAYNLLCMEVESPYHKNEIMKTEELKWGLLYDTDKNISSKLFSDTSDVDQLHANHHRSIWRI